MSENRYRPPRPGDLIAVRTSDPRLDEVQVILTTVADNGDFIYLAGAHGDHDIEVIVRRVGTPSLRFLEK
jgi:hypothetical protein